MPVIDAHHHIWDLSAHDQPWLASDPELAPLRRNFTVADLAAEAAAEDVTATVLVQTVSEPWETPELLATAAAGGLVAGVVGWVDLASADVAGSIAERRDLPAAAEAAAALPDLQFVLDHLGNPEVVPTCRHRGRTRCGRSPRSRTSLASYPASSA